MIVIPSINCADTACVHKKMNVSQAIGASWVHVDVADGVFAPVVLFEHAQEFWESARQERFSGYVEVHLMVMHPEPYVRSWLTMGAKRIIVHAEVIQTLDALNTLQSLCGTYNAEFGLAVRSETERRIFEPFLDSVDFWTVLAVPPGFSGGTFDGVHAPALISFLRERMPECVIEIDGGINEKTGKLVKDCGVDIIVSGQFIFGHVDPKNAYHTLCDL